MRATPHPGIAEPEGRKKDDFGWFAGAIRDGDPDVDIVWRLFRVFGEHVEIAAAFKDARVDELILGEIRGPDRDSREPVDRTERPLADTCKAPSGKSEWATNRDRNSTP